MILMWSLNKYLKLKRETRQRQKFGSDVKPANIGFIVNFSNLWPVWSSPETGLRAHDLQYLHFK